MKLNLSRFGFLTLIIAVVLTGCSRSPNKALIGSWHHENGRTFIFQKDGSFTLISGTRQAHGTYTIIDPMHIRMTIPLKDTNSVTDYKFSILDGDMTFESVANGTTGRLHRIQN